MANMFSRQIKKEIPRSVDDCIKPDLVSTNLWEWCEWIEKWGKILFWVLLIGGLVLSISGSIVEKQVVVKEATRWSEAEKEIRTTFDFERFIPLLLDTILYAFLEYCVYHVIALLIGALASVVQNTRISANVALYNTTYKPVFKATSDTNAEKNTKTVETNLNESSECDCDEDGSVVPIVHGNQEIICPNCGFKQSINRKVCWKCGIKFIGCASNDSVERKTDSYRNTEKVSTHSWRCRCGSMISTSPCPFCGENKEDTEKN